MLWIAKNCMLGRKVIYARCINCSYNNVAKGVRLLDKKAFFVYTGKKIMQVRGFERYIPLVEAHKYSCKLYIILASGSQNLGLNRKLSEVLGY